MKNILNKISDWLFIVYLKLFPVKDFHPNTPEMKECSNQDHQNKNIKGNNDKAEMAAQRYRHTSML